MSNQLKDVTVEGIKIKSHTVQTKEGENIYGFMVYLNEKKMGFFSAKRLAGFQKGLRESGPLLIEMLKESMEHTKKGFDVAFGEAKPPEGAAKAKTKTKTKAKKTEGDDLCFDNIVPETTIQPQVQSQPQVQTQTTQVEDNHDVFDCLGF